VREFLLPTLVIGGVVLLVRSGVEHLGHRRRLALALDEQDLLPPGLRRLVAAGLGPIELAVATLGGIALATGTGVGVASVALGALGLGFGAFLIAVHRLRPGAPCGCSGDDDSTGASDGLRAGLVLAAGLSLAAAQPIGLAGGELTTVLVAGLAISAVVDVTAAAS
jgi:hypothetical protein